MEKNYNHIRNSTKKVKEYTKNDYSVLSTFQVLKSHWLGGNVAGMEMGCISGGKKNLSWVMRIPLHVVVVFSKIAKVLCFFSSGEHMFQTLKCHLVPLLVLKSVRQNLSAVLLCWCLLLVLQLIAMKSIKRGRRKRWSRINVFCLATHSIPFSIF